MSSSEKSSKEDATPQKFRCESCPYVAKTTDSLENHARHHVLNPDAEFICKKCPFYCSTKIELGIHSMVHAMERKAPEEPAASEIPEKRIKIETETMSLSPPQARSRMSPFKKASSLSPNQKTMKRNLSTDQIKEKHRGSSESGIRSSPTKSIWKIKLHTRSPSPANSVSSPGNKRKALFPCDFCPYIAHSKKELEYHADKHTLGPDRPFKCELCPYYTVNNAALTNHKRVHVGGKVEPESVTDEIDDEANSVSYSKTSSPDEKKTNNRRSSLIAATCSLCPQTFTMKSNIHKHLKFHAPSPNRPHKCDYCSYCTASKGSLGIHTSLHLDQKDNDQAEAEYACEEEQEEEEEEEEADEVEEENVEMGGVDEIDEIKYDCNICPYTTPHRRLIKVHREQHNPSAERQACCPYCPYYVTVPKALSRHMIVHKKRQFTATKKRHSLSSSANVTPNKSQNTEDEMDDSESTVTKSDISEEGKPKKKQYSCDICPYTTRHWNLIHTHKIQHTSSEDRQACCDYCPYYVTVKSALARHMMIHKEYREKKEQYRKMYDANKKSLDSSQNCEDNEEEFDEEEQFVAEEDADEDVDNDSANEDNEDDDGHEEGMEDDQSDGERNTVVTSVHTKQITAA